MEPQTEVENSLKDTIGQLGLALDSKFFVESRTPSNIWRKFSSGINLDERTSYEIEKEYDSSVHWQGEPIVVLTGYSLTSVQRNPIGTLPLLQPSALQA